MKSIRTNLLILLIFTLSACGIGSKNDSPPNTKPANLTNETAAKSSATAGEIISLVARFARGATLLQGKLREGPFPSAATIKQSTTISAQSITPRVTSFGEQFTAGCPVITQPDVVSSAGFTITADWGKNGCIDTFDGIQRKGIIKVSLSDLEINLRNDEIISGKAIVDFDEFGTEKQKIKGSVNIDIDSTESEQWQININLTGDINATLVAHTTVTTEDSSDIETINGTGTLSTVGGESTQFSYKDLELDQDWQFSPFICAYPIGGTAQLTGANKVIQTFDLENAGCGYAMQSIDDAEQNMIYIGASDTPATDLALNSYYYQSDVSVNSTFVWSVGVTNNGLIAAHDIEVTYKVSGIDEAIAYTDTGDCDTTNHTCVVKLKTINPGMPYQGSLQVTFAKTGFATLSVSATSSTSDPNQINNETKRGVNIYASSYPSFPSVPQVYTLKLENTNIPIGGSGRFTVVDQDGSPYWATFTWASSNEDIATIDNNGVLTGHKQGSTEITAVGNGFTIEPYTATISSDEIRIVTLASNDLVYDSMHEKILVSVPSQAGKVGNVILGNTITLLDPVSGNNDFSIYAGSEPSKLVISEDMSKLYTVLNGAGAISPIDITSNEQNVLSLTTGSTFSVGKDQWGSELNTNDIEIMPGHPETIVISRSGANSSGNSVAVFDNGIMRPNTADFSYGGSRAITFSDDPSVVYGYDNKSTLALYRLAIDEQGISYSVLANKLITGYYTDITFKDGAIYTTDGKAVDPLGLVSLGTFTMPKNSYTNVASYFIDAAKKRIYFLKSNNSSIYSYVIQAFDTTHFIPLGEFPLRLTSTNISSYSDPNASSLIRWGDNGLAFRTTTGEICLIKWSVVSAP